MVKKATAAPVAPQVATVAFRRVYVDLPGNVDLIVEQKSKAAGLTKKKLIENAINAYIAKV